MAKPVAPSPETLELHGMRLTPGLFNAHGPAAARVEALLAAGADPNPPSTQLAMDGDDEAAYPLHIAAASANAAWVARLLAAGARPVLEVDDEVASDQSHSPTGPFNPLGTAVWGLVAHATPAYLEVIGLLLDAGADPLLADPFTLRYPFQDFVADVGPELQADPAGPLGALVLPTLERLLGAMPEDLRQGFWQALHDGGSPEYPEAQEILTWPGVSEKVRARALERALAPAAASRPSVRI